MRNVLAETLLVLSLLSGCGTSSATTPDAAADLAPMGPCKGTISGAILGKFTPCTITMLQDTGDQVLRLIPGGYDGEPLDMVLWAPVAIPAFAAKHYTMADLASGTEMTLTTKFQMSRFRAVKTDTATTGTIDLTLSTLPKQPPGEQTWEDHSAHGTLKAMLPLDPNTPGHPGDTITVEVAF